MQMQKYIVAIITFYSMCKLPLHNSAEKSNGGKYVIPFSIDCKILIWFFHLGEKTDIFNEA